ncbi:Thiazole synthase protein [Salinisphaera shabanensis E1L3A]|uniref:Thiazole synthase n=1 Tax=Salinisphaera shabanensis E1L3A TaxID=1033802 RepID=U2E969_9GAMM|nr:sulfur carrier protein ThiS [Salinisphaera shabanensis]ERJ20246.1 Thiazole synthase protein [Salinisphaera shabanensis E1L3A]
MQIEVNGAPTQCAEHATLAQLVSNLGYGDQRIAVEHNGQIVPRDRYEQTMIAPGDTLEIVQAIGGGQAIAESDQLTIAGRKFESRLLVGTGKYANLDEADASIRASGAEIVTLAIRRTPALNDPEAAKKRNLLDIIPPEKYTLLPNTAGCYSAEDAVRTCRMARELLDGHNLVKLEVLGDKKTLYPDMSETLVAAQQLVDDGFEVMVYTSDDPIAARRLEDIGCVAIMPLAGPIGSGLGIQNRYNVIEIVENANVPVLVDAGVGTASDASIAMEMGCDGVLMNSAIAHANKPILMAQAMRHAVIAGRMAFLAGRMPRRRYASASSPMTDLPF